MTAISQPENATAGAERAQLGRTFAMTVVSAGYGVLTAGLVSLLGAVTAFFEVRRGRPAWTCSGSIGWVSMAVIGALVGASITREDAARIG